MRSLLILLGLAGPPDMTAPVAVEAAYVIHTQTFEDAKQCCGQCKNGVITHGDGHRTPCPCPPDCKCKAVAHPPTIIRADCKDGQCKTLQK